MKIELIQLKELGDERGFLVALEVNKDIPFSIKRVYYMHGLSSVTPRGFHAHRDLRQVAICITGNCKFVMDDGISRNEYTLSNSSTGILIDKMIWHEMHDFSDDCVLMVVASDVYDESDYIRNYKQFAKMVSDDS